MDCASCGSKFWVVSLVVYQKNQLSTQRLSCGPWHQRCNVAFRRGYLHSCLEPGPATSQTFYWRLKMFNQQYDTNWYNISKIHLKKNKWIKMGGRYKCTWHLSITFDPQHPSAKHAKPPPRYSAPGFSGFPRFPQVQPQSPRSPWSPGSPGSTSQRRRCGRSLWGSGLPNPCASWNML